MEERRGRLMDAEKEGKKLVGVKEEDSGCFEGETEAADWLGLPLEEAAQRKRRRIF